MHVNRVFEIDESVAHPVNKDGVDEIKVARIIGADGLLTYMVRPPAGSPSTAFRAVLATVNAGQKNATATDEVASNVAVGRALRALEDVGLVTITLGPRGNFYGAIVRWTDRAYLRSAAGAAA